MAATRAREQGYLVIADISGYTAFLTRTDYLTLETTPINRGPIALPRSLSTFEFAEDGPGRSVVTMSVRAMDRGLLGHITLSSGSGRIPACNRGRSRELPCRVSPS